MSARLLRIAALLLVFSLIAASAFASYAQQGSKLVGAGAVGPAYQGISVALSADGNTALVGGHQDNSGAGAVWVYTRTNNVWSQQGLKLVGTGAVGNAFQGVSVALSADGNTALIGGYLDNTNIGAVWVFVRSGGVWTQQGPKLVGTGGVGAQYQGVAVALSADGNTAIVGGYFDNAQKGAAWVFVRSGGVWAQQSGKLVGTGSVGASYQGVAVALSSDGNTALVGGYQDNASLGAVWVYTRSGTVWSQQGSKLTGSGGVGATQYQGVSVALSSDGNTAAFGGYYDNSQSGAFWVFTRSAGVWTQQGSKLIATDAVGTAYFGYRVALSADGNLAVASGYGDNGSMGAMWAFNRSGSVWSQQGAKVVGTGNVGNASQGVCLALSADGQTAMSSGYTDNSNAGAAWVFVVPNPAIVSVRDVPNDQGGKVTLRWNAGALDNGVVDQYWIWRQVPNQHAQQALAQRASIIDGGSGGVAPSEGALRATIQAGQTYYWEYVGSQIAHGFPGYSYTTSTFSDSVAGSNPYTLFMVEAEKTSTGQYWSSAPDSGYSVDNLGPAAPAAFAGNRSSGTTYLHWAVNGEADLAGYRLYRGSSAGFSPDASSLISAQPDTGYADASAAGSYYKLSAVDVHGNESNYALLSPGGTVSVGDGGLAAFALQGVRPNPARSSGLHVQFTLASAASARLELVDVNGRRMLAREVGALGAGPHAVDLAGSAKISPGVYWLRLVQGPNQRSVRVAVIE